LAETCRVVVVDRPGSGYSTALSGVQPTLREQAAIIARFIEQLGLERPLLVGHSLGGALSLALALDHPERIRAVLLISPVSQVVRVPPKVFKVLFIRSPFLRGLVAWTLMAPLGKLAHRATLKGVFDPEPAPAAFNIAGGGVLGLRPGNFIAASSDMMMLPDELEQMVPRYPSLTMPVDVVFGRDDPICPYQVHGVRLAAAMANARLHVIEGGHMIPITAPDEIVQRIRQALVAS
jgi:pimeloyl-ACP methyl ester carboxylesterase